MLSVKLRVSLTEHGELDVLGGGAQAVGGRQAVEGAVMPAGLLDQQRALVLGHQFADVLVVPDGGLLLRFGHGGLLPGERWERTAAHFRHDADITVLLALHGVTQHDGGSACKIMDALNATILKTSKSIRSVHSGPTIVHISS